MPTVCDNLHSVGVLPIQRTTGEGVPAPSTHRFLTSSTLVLESCHHLTLSELPPFPSPLPTLFSPYPNFTPALPSFLACPLCTLASSFSSSTFLTHAQLMPSS